MSESAQPERLYSWPEVRPLVGNVSRMTWYRAVKRGDAPPPVVVTPGRVAWTASSIAAYQARAATGAHRAWQVTNNPQKEAA